MKTSVKYILSTVAVIGAVVLILMMNRKSVAEKTTFSSSEATAVMVRTQTVTASDYSASFSSNGTLMPRQELTYMSDVSGRVVTIFADKGDYVRKGAVLLKIDDELLKADYEASKYAYESALKDYERFKNAQEGGGVSSQQLDGIEGKLVAAESRYIVSKRRYEDASVKAPISGVINNRYFEIGSLLNPGARLYDIVDDSSLKVICNVSETQVLEVKKGDSVSVDCGIFKDETFNGTVVFVGKKSDRGLNYPVEVSISSKDKKDLLAGMYVTVNFKSGEEKSGIFIPRKAISGSVKSADVYVVENNIAHRREVTVGKMSGNQIEILSGLAEGDKVIVSGLINVSEGVEVQEIIEK